MQTVVDLSRLRHNIRIIKARTGNRFCAVVKANAYGHGMVVAKYIEQLCDAFFVSNYDEAASLRDIGIKKPILVLGGEISPFLRRIDPLILPTACDPLQLSELLRVGYSRFSIAVDTGMHRLGAGEKALSHMIDICRMNNAVPSTVYSHIYDGAASAAEQSEVFERLTRPEILKKCRHLYSSCALDVQDSSIFDMTRAGIAMYGYGACGVKPCMRVRAKIVALSLVKKGEHVGYGQHTVEKDTLIATVACGYADGLRRCENRLYLKVRGIKCPLVGVPCMDVCMIDVTDAPCRVGEFAYLIDGCEDGGFLARSYGTIIYEVLTGFNGRNERIYI